MCAFFIESPCMPLMPRKYEQFRFKMFFQKQFLWSRHMWDIMWKAPHLHFQLFFSACLYMLYKWSYAAVNKTCFADDSLRLNHILCNLLTFVQTYLSLFDILEDLLTLCSKTLWFSISDDLNFVSLLYTEALKKQKNESNAAQMCYFSKTANGNIWEIYIYFWNPRHG